MFQASFASSKLSTSFIGVNFVHSITTFYSTAVCKRCYEFINCFVYDLLIALHTGITSLYTLMRH